MDKFEINREDYINGSIFRVGDLVEDLNSGLIMQILDRGTNYITVLDEQTGDVVKKWIKDVKPTTEEKEPNQPVIVEGQLQWGVTQTEHLDEVTAGVLAEMYNETTDLFAWRQTIVTLDKALDESTDKEQKYELLSRVEAFFENMGCTEQLPIVTEKKSVLEQQRIAEIIANVAEIESKGSPKATVEAAINALKKKNLNPKQWKVVSPMLRVAMEAGITFNVPAQMTEKFDFVDQVLDLIEENLDLFESELTIEDLLEEFTDDELSDETLDEETINEVLSYGSRLKLSQAAKRRSPELHLKMTRKINRAASSKEKLARARKMALTALKRRMFRKSVADLSPGEKQRFEKGAAKRKALVARLAQRMLRRVNTLQTQRLRAK